jgi:hypothetical protein
MGLLLLWGKFTNLSVKRSDNFHKKTYFNIVFQELFPAFRYIFFFVKEKGCHFNLGYVSL